MTLKISGGCLVNGSLTVRRPKWQEVAKLLGSQSGPTGYSIGERFGESSSLSGDGNTLIVGARYEEHSGFQAAGAAYIFSRINGSWLETQRLQRNPAALQQRFGNAVSISNDGTTLAIGAYYTDDPISNEGRVYIYGLSGGTWVEEASLVSSDVSVSDTFGVSVALSNDGNTLVVGADLEDTKGTNAGAAYIFTRVGGTWTEEQKLLGSDLHGDLGPPDNIGDRFGYTVSISNDGNTVIIGAFEHDLPGGTPGFDAGAAYVFVRSGGTWVEEQKLQPSDIEAGDVFGFSIALSADGNIAAIGSYSEDTGGGSKGALYIFTRSGGTWTEEQKIQTPQITQYFGYSVGMTPDGKTIIVAARLEDAPVNNAGAAYILTKVNGTWTIYQRLSPSDIAVEDQAGFSVSISSDGKTAAVGAALEDTSGTDAGAVYVFELK